MLTADVLLWTVRIPIKFGVDSSSRFYRAMLCIRGTSHGPVGLHPLRSLVTSVLSHVGPRSEVHIHFGF